MEPSPAERESDSRGRLGGFGLLLGLVLTSGLAFFWPALVGSDASIDPFVLNKSGLWLLVSVTMLCLGMVVQRSELVELRRSPANVFVGLLIQTLCMPLFAWIATRVLQLDGDLAAGVILVGCVPGAMASNVLTMTARGNVSYSVCLTAVATLASPVTVPVLLGVFAGASAKGADPLTTSQTLLMTVVLPIAVGFAAKELWNPLRRVAAHAAPILASVALLWIIASVVAGNRDRIAQVDATVFLALAVVNLAGYSAGWSVGRLVKMPASMRRALTLEVGMQNAGVGTALAASLYGSDSLAQIPTAAYTFGCMATGTILAAIWAGASEGYRGEERDVTSISAEV